MKTKCTCGHVLELDPVPDEDWVTIRTKECSPWLHGLATNEAALSEIRGHLGCLYECPQCGRLKWFKPGSETAVIYRRED